jgi:hypothetical protein
MPTRLVAKCIPTASQVKGEEDGPERIWHRDAVDVSKGY